MTKSRCEAGGRPVGPPVVYSAVVLIVILSLNLILNLILGVGRVNLQSHHHHNDEPQQSGADVPPIWNSKSNHFTYRNGNYSGPIVAATVRSVVASG
jgi:hypothetical protein